MMRFLVLALTMMTFLAQQAAAQDWTILEYDSNGHVVGSRSGKGAAPKGQGATVEPDQLLAVNASEDDLTFLKENHFKVLHKRPMTGLGFVLYEIGTPPNMGLIEALKFLEEKRPNLLVDTNDMLDLSSGAASSSSPKQVAQSLDFTRYVSGWGLVPESCGRGIVMGQIDGFVDVNHPALRGKDLITENFIKEGRTPAAEDHGTAVSIILIGRPINGQPGGLLPGARLYAANIFELRNGQESGNLAAMVRAVDWLAKNGVQVANLSVAGKLNKIMQIAVNRASQKGVLIVAAAGNNGPGAPPAWPAAFPKALAVTAVDRSLHLYRFANRGSYIDFAAPGVDIPTDTPHGLKMQSGTSFAAPFVTAMVAIHIKAGFKADADLIRRSLKRYTKDLGVSGKDETYGWGLVRLKPSC